MKHLIQKKIVLFIAVLFAGASAEAQVARSSFLGPEGGLVNVVRGTMYGDTLWAGLQRYGDAGQNQHAGIYTSFNEGKSWQRTSVGFTSVVDIEAQPNDSRHVLAATEAGIFSSTDGGATWTASANLSSNFNCVAFAAVNPSVIFAGGSGIQKSTDGGATWSDLGFGYPVRALALDPNDPRIVVYAGTENAGVFKSTDGGATWISMKSNLTLPAALSIRSLTINPLIPANIVAGTDAGPYFILDFPGSWFSFPNGILDSIAQSVAIVVGDTINRSQNSLRYYVGTKGNDFSQRAKPVHGGLYISSTSTTWNPIFAKNVDVNSIFVAPKNPTKVFIGTSDGVYTLQNDGSAVSRIDAGIDDNRIASVAVSHQHFGLMYAAVFGGGVLKTTDGGKSWLAANNGIQNPYVRAVAVDPADDSTVYAASALGVFKSTDGGATWNELSVQWPHKFSPAQENLYFNLWISVSPVNSKNIVVSSEAADYFASTDKGISWNVMKTPLLSDSTVITNQITFDPKDGNTMYFTQKDVWKSTDFGAAWTDITGDLPFASTNSIGGHLTIDPNNSSRMYLPLYNSYVPIKAYQTQNGGVNWLPVNLDSIVDISIHKDSPATLFAATSSSVYRSADSGATWLKITPDSLAVTFLALTPNPSDNNIQYAGSTDGLFRVEYAIEPELQFTTTSLDFGTAMLGQAVPESLSFSNQGGIQLRVEFSGIKGSSDFFFQNDSISFVDPGQTKTYAVSYIPHSPGAAAAALQLVTNDPNFPFISVALSGAGVAKNPITRTILFDTTHGIASGTPDSVADGAIFNSVEVHFSQLISVLQKAGITVTLNGIDSTHYNMIVIAEPARSFSLDEIKSIQRYVLDGGSMVLLGNGKSSVSNDVVNGILSDFRWKTDLNAPTGLLLNSSSVVVDPVHEYLSDSSSPFFTAFVDTSHPYLKGVDTIVAFNSASIALSDSAFPFLKGAGSTYALNAGSGKDSSQPVLIAVSQLGKGKIILFGGAEMWGNGRTAGSDSSTGIFAKNNLQFALNVFSYADNYLVRMPQPTPDQEYRIISIPFDLNDFSIADVLKDLGAVNPLNWRLYGHWNDALGQYAEFPSPDFYSFKRGEGYWLITKGARTLTLGNATVTPAQGFFAIKLGPGYNLIGNPFPYTVSWQNSVRPASVEPYLWSFDGAQFILDSTLMDPFAGYFLKNLSSDSVTIYINPEQITVTRVSKTAHQSLTERQFGTGEWEVQLKAADGSAKDEQNYAGVLSSAKNEWDANDFSEPPPAPGNYVMLSFNEKKWKKYGGWYAGDFHAPNSDGQYWDFDVAAAKLQDHVSLSFLEYGNVPSSFGVYLVDMQTERVTEMFSPFAYGFSMEKGETDRSFRLLIGKKEFVKQNTNGVPLVPLAFSLEQNFPNPFNPTTTIHYTLGHSGHIVLEIYNVLGQRVRQLVEADQPIGTYSVLWDGKSDGGVSAASGVYFYRIRTQTFSDVKRMVLIK